MAAKRRAIQMYLSGCGGVTARCVGGNGSSTTTPTIWRHAAARAFGTATTTARGAGIWRRGCELQRLGLGRVDVAMGVGYQKLWNMRKRYNSSSSSGSSGSNGEDKGVPRIWEFNDVLQMIENPSSSILLIDVREPHEFSHNTIPTAHNLPIVSHPDALFLSADEFHERLGYAKPALDKEVVFFCKAGVRSRAAAGFARRAGYTNVGEYRGSWNDWVTKGGPGTTTPSPPGGIGEGKGPVS